jgi:hypothetical protein
MNCEDTDLVFPLTADIYYPIVSQSAYGDINKKWVLDRTVACFFAPGSRKSTPEVTADIELIQDNLLIGRARKDIRFSKDGLQNAITNVLITNIKDGYGNELYKETSGVRQGKSTIFEVASNEPIVGPFKNIEFWRVLIRRSENQGADV